MPGHYISVLSPFYGKGDIVVSGKPTLGMPLMDRTSPTSSDNKSYWSFAHLAAQNDYFWSKNMI